MTKIKCAASQLYKWTMSHKSGIVFSLLTLAVFALLPKPAHATITGTLSTLSDLASIGDFVIALLSTILGYIVELVGKLIVLLLGAIIIPILGYNQFGDSTIISIGWPLVRDAVNMFVIVILLVIAIQTIVGYKQANWSEQLPQFFLAVVLANFSRTICLLAIDVSQVIMFTFVNALRDIAAGNFMNLFQINDFTTLIATDDAELITIFAEHMITLSLLMMVLGTIGILAIVYLYRIILIWILVIISPLAFFLRSSPISTSASNYKQWWSMFTGALTLGPILTFFLWLALAVSSTRSIAVTEGLNFEGTTDTPIGLASILEADKLVSLLMAIVLIMAGFKVSSSAASAMGSFAAKWVSEGVGTKMAKSALTLPPSLLYRGAKRGVKEVGRQVASRGVGQQLGAEISKAGAGIAASGVIGGDIVGRGIIQAGGKLRGAAEVPEVKARKDARERFAAQDKDTSAAMLNSYFDETGKIKPAMLGKTGKDMDANIMEALSDSTYRKKVKETMGDEKFEGFMASAMGHVDKNKDKLFTGEKDKDNFTKMKRGNIGSWLKAKEMMNPDGTIPIDKLGAAQKEVGDLLTDEKMSPEQMAKQVTNPNDVQKGGAVAGLLKGVSAGKRFNKDGSEKEMSIFDHIEEGKGIKADVREAAKTGFVGKVDLSTDSIAAIAAAATAGKISASDITAAVAARPGVTEGLASGGFDFGTISPAISAGMLGALRMHSATTKTSPTASLNEKANVRKSAISAGAAAGATPAAGNDLSIEQVFNIEPTSKEMQEGSTQELANLLKTDMKKYKEQIKRNMPAAGGAANDISEATMKAYSQANLAKVLKEYKAEGDPAAQAELKDIVAQYRAAFNAENTRTVNNAGAPVSKMHDNKKMESINREIRSIEREMRP